MTTLGPSYFALLNRAANRLDRHRNAMFVVAGASWIALAALTFALRSTATRGRGIALAVAIALILVEQWVLFLWSWFRDSNVSVGGSGAQTRATIRALFLLAFGIVVILVSWKMTTFFTRL